MQRIYYTGDMANQPGWFTTEECFGGLFYGPFTITEEPGELSENREFHLMPANVGSVYAGHCNPRFVTAEAYNAYRKAQFSEYERSAALYRRELVSLGTDDDTPEADAAQYAAEGR